MDYNEWADAIATYWLGVSTDGEAVLALEPSILWDVAHEVGVEFDSADEAVESFVDSVRIYQSERGRPWRFEATSEKNPPRFLLLVAVQVFAASQMDDAVGEHTSRAYYVQLAKLVGDSAMGANFAADHGVEHRELWRYLKKWLRKHNREIQLPPDKKGTHDRNVGLPKSQALLRRADLAQLPLFFRNCGYRPRGSLTSERVAKDVRIRRYNFDCFPSSWARRVLEDEHRFPTACRQIFNEFQQWDGEWELATPGKRTRERDGGNKCWFGISAKRAQLVTKFGASLQTATTLPVDDLRTLLAGRKTVNGSRLKLIDGMIVSSGGVMLTSA